MARERTRARMAPPRTQRRWWRAQSSRFRYQARGLANCLHSGVLGDGLEALLRAEEEGRGQGNDGQGDEERGQEGEGDGQAEGLGHFAGDARGEDHGEEDGDRRQGRSRDGHADLGGPGDTGLVGSFAFLEMPVDVLDDDDGVVDEHADAQGQASERQQVEGVAGRVEGDEGGDDGQGDGQADDEGRPPVPQEGEDEEDGQKAAHPGVGDRIAGRLLDHIALVHGDVEDGIAGHGPDELLDLRLDGRAGDLGVGARALADDEVDPVLPLDPRGVAHLLEGVLDLGDVRDVDGLAGRGHADDGPADVVEALELAHGPDEDLRVALDEVPGGQVEVLRPQGHPDLVEGQAPALEGGPVDVDQDLALVHGEDPGRGDAVDALEARRDLVLDDRLEPHGRQVAGDAVEDDRERAEAELHDQRLAGLLREVLFVEADLIADVLGGEVEVGAPLELDADDRDALGRLRRDLLDPVDRADDLFEGPGQDVLDVLGRGARVGRDDGDRREFEVGEEVQPQPGEGDGAQDDQDGRHHGRGDFAVDREFGELHFFTSSRTWIGEPSSRP